MSTLPRLIMERSTEPVPDVTVNGDVIVRNISDRDGKIIGELLYQAYKGTIDDEGQSEHEAIAEAEETLKGKYGEVLWHASYIAHFGNVAASVCLVTNYQALRPLLAFAATHPQHQRKGLAGGLIMLSIASLHEQGCPILNLVVTEGNPAQTLYEKLGFTNKGRK